MAVLATEFDVALSRIEPSDADKENAPDAHEKVRAVLKNDLILAGCVVEPVLIGSYKRYVSIRRVKDVDVFCRLEKLPADVTPEALLERFEQVLTEEYGAERVINRPGRCRSHSPTSMASTSMPCRRAPLATCGDSAAREQRLAEDEP